LVVVKVFGYIADIVGWDEKSVDVKGEAELRELLESIVEQEKLVRIIELIGKGQAKILVNGVEASLSTIMQQGDEVAIIPLPSGG
jgi:molybdopterin converting factor small subunit